MRQRGRGTDAFFNCFLVVALGGGVAAGAVVAGRSVAIATTTSSTSRDLVQRRLR